VVKDRKSYRPERHRELITSTRLHMDVADAVNVMLYASDRPEGQPGCAAWDLFRAEDADKIRLYLKNKFDKTHKFTDPIHSQLFYLDSNKRKELAERYGVVSWRVYQYPVSLDYVSMCWPLANNRVKRCSFLRDVRIKCATWQTVSRSL
jgi:hypothetical protein